MKLLILGGSGFVGRAVADDAVRRGHEVTVFNRGQHDNPAGVTALIGDRDFRIGLSALATGEWDAVIDTWSGDAEAVERAVALLRGRVGHYTYVSTRSVYEYGEPGAVLDEQAPLIVDAERGYCGDKRRGEIAAVRFDGPVLLARPGLILGPHEDVGRLTWWLTRLARGGPTLAPEPRELPLQFIDVRDLAIFLVGAVEAGLTGPYNLCSPVGHTTMGELLETGNEVTGGRAQLCWTKPAEIVGAGIRPWTQLPIWEPPGVVHELVHLGDATKAVAAGLRCRPACTTVIDTWAWLSSLPGGAPQREDRARVGLDPDVEEKVLAASGTA
jgi:nucleoside-diphosphate-sugar epimerase